MINKKRNTVLLYNFTTCPVIYNLLSNLLQEFWRKTSNGKKLLRSAGPQDVIQEKGKCTSTRKEKGGRKVLETEERNKEDLKCQVGLKKKLNSDAVPPDLDVYQPRKRSIQDRMLQSPHSVSRSQSALYSPLRGGGISKKKFISVKTSSLFDFWEQRGLKGGQNLPVDGVAQKTKPRNNLFLSKQSKQSKSDGQNCEEPMGKQQMGQFLDPPN